MQIKIRIQIFIHLFILVHKNLLSVENIRCLRCCNIE